MFDYLIRWRRITKLTKLIPKIRINDGSGTAEMLNVCPLSNVII